MQAFDKYLLPNWNFTIKN